MKTGSNCKLHGVIPAIVTPLRPNGDVDEALLRKQTEYLVSSGVNGLFVCGGTGEGAYLTTAEKKRVFEVIQETAAGRVFLCLAVINSNTRATLAELEALSICKPDFFVSTPPYYHAMTQQDILSHYAAVTAASTAPVILYNIPSTTHNTIELDTVYALSKLPNVAVSRTPPGILFRFPVDSSAPARTNLPGFKARIISAAPPCCAAETVWFQACPTPGWSPMWRCTGPMSRGTLTRS